MTEHRTGIALLIAAVVFFLLGLGLAFTIFGEIELPLAVIALAAAVVVTSRSHRR